ncbi:MAG: hypothetical protein QNJ31_07900 [Candidatus Caenarcaniphilales bacterium]|nr:hypothetical protein [Candidatus Caenarcaniphilales bacterium]
MNNFNFVKQKSSTSNDENFQSNPQMLDLATSSDSSNGPVLKVSERKNEYKGSESIHKTIALGRKKKHNQTPSEIISETASKPILNSKDLADCEINISLPSQENIPESKSSQTIKLTSEELEDLVSFIEEIQRIRQQEEKEEQEKRSAIIAKKISVQDDGSEFLQEHNISSISEEENSETWVQSLNIMKDSGESEEISQPLNFYSPQHSWILENWLSELSTSWSVRRYNQSENKIVFQISFGFPDQTFIEAEGPSREGAIMAVAEDLLS